MVQWRLWRRWSTCTVDVAMNHDATYEDGDGDDDDVDADDDDVMMRMVMII